MGLNLSHPKKEEKSIKTRSRRSKTASVVVCLGASGHGMVSLHPSDSMCCHSDNVLFVYLSRTMPNCILHILQQRGSNAKLACLWFRPGAL